MLWQHKRQWPDFDEDCIIDVPLEMTYAHLVVGFHWHKLHTSTLHLTYCLIIHCWLLIVRTKDHGWFPHLGQVTLVALMGPIYLSWDGCHGALSLRVKPLQIISRSDTRRRRHMPDLQMSCRDLSASKGTRIVVPVMVSSRHIPFICLFPNLHIMEKIYIYKTHYAYHR